MAAEHRQDARVRRWVVRRVTERGSWWLYFLGDRVTLFRYHGGLLALYINTSRFNLNWRLHGRL